MAKLPKGVADRTCLYGTCVYCAKSYDKGVCKDWFPMRPGCTVEKYHTWLRKRD